MQKILKSVRMITWKRNHYLDVIVRIPVRVVDDDSVCTRKVDAKTSGSCWKQEAELLSARCCDRKNKTPKHRVSLCVSELKPCRGKSASIRTHTDRFWINKLTVEAVNGLLPEASSNPSINTLIFISLELQKILQQIQHLCHLRRSSRGWDQTKWNC